MTQNNLQTLPLITEHLDAVWAIEQQAHSHPWAQSMIRDLSHQNTPNSSKHQFGLWLDQTLVGYYYSQNVVGEVTLLTIAVDPSQQGKGYGRMLMQHLIEHSEACEAESIWLEVRASNTGAYHLYESLGFNEMDRRVNYYPSQTSKSGKEDAIIMNLLLDSGFNPFS
ncbi:ribosomal protein S18-alanine N-acetyltransferase [Vibrio rumoiensis]|uniref:[Ribosomal protein bS18]-alanine N-acetyltransferase n=1 Tax=Vibrio rumoiensis 1S-45 TaxID=1188252 RepID=A0A1E5E2R8_9VIBR|nr:ribosomal protein S18-alanine N-acetyltransferase [Vibrio rumoiensis]OEF25849.1 ribosomal-protein-alanine N-acetyltransferase [Vibrio rumoiensis 1S-45]